MELCPQIYNTGDHREDPFQELLLYRNSHLSSPPGPSGPPPKPAATALLPLSACCSHSAGGQLSKRTYSSTTVKCMLLWAGPGTVLFLHQTPPCPGNPLLLDD